MSCLKSLSGLGRQCESNLPGIKRVLFANREDISGVTFVDSSSGITVSSITMETGAKFYAYYFAKNTGSLVTTQVRNEENGSNYYTSVITLQFNKLEAAKHIEISALAEGNLIAIVTDNNDVNHLVGYDEYLSSDGSEIAATGASADDRNGYALTLSATERKIGRIVPDTVLASLPVDEPTA